MSIKKENPYHHSPSQVFRIPMGQDILNVELTGLGNKTGIVVSIGETLENRAPFSQTSVTDVFSKYGLATLLPNSAFFKDADFDISKVADRLEHVVLWTRHHPETASPPLGCFAAGERIAAATLIAAARRPDLIKAIVLRGGKLDQVLEYLPLVKAPVLLIAAGRNPECLNSRRRALERLNKNSTLNVIPHASQSFQEPGAMEESAQLTALWFLQHL